MVSINAVATAADFNTLATAVNALYATGTGQSGYGQTLYPIPTVAANGRVTQQDWGNLRNALNAVALHTGTTGSPFPTLPAINTTITASDFNALTLYADTCVINKALAQSGDMATIAASGSGFVTTRSSIWGSGVSASLMCTVTVSFGSENACRAFFNSGGELRLRMTHGSVSSPQDSEWQNFLQTKCATISLAANAVSRSGTTGSVFVTGFWSLTTAFQTIFMATDGGVTAYASNTAAIQAKVGGVVGLNGGNGSSVVITCTLNDIHTGSLDSVAAGTAFNVDVFKVNGALSGMTIAMPAASSTGW